VRAFALGRVLEVGEGGRVPAFTGSIGQTVQEWIIECRMAEARRLLTGTDMPVGEISRRVGIANPGYFTRLFRRAHGVSPRLWRGQQKRLFMPLARRGRVYEIFKFECAGTPVSPHDDTVINKQ